VIPTIRVNLRRAIGDKRVVALATLFPFIFILVTGLLAGNPREPIGLVHPSQRLVTLIAHTPDLKARMEANRAALTDDILRGRVVAGLISFPARPGSQRVEFISESAQTSAVQARTDVVAILDLIAAEGTHGTLTDTLLARAHLPAPLSPFSYVAPSDLVLFLGITMLVLSSGLVESRRLGMLRRISAAPVRRRSVVAAQIVSLLIIAAGQSLGLLFVGRFLFGVHWGNPGAVGLIVALLSISFASASVLIGSWSRTEEQAVAVAVVLGIAAGMLGGCMYPLSVVGSVVREAGHVMPQAWAMDAFIKLIYDHGTFVAVLPEISALAVFALVFSALASRVYAVTVYSPG
jgi:ABC-2 type transport system permease protein